MQLCGAWITLDKIPADQSLEFLDGSHLGPLYALTFIKRRNDALYPDWPRIPNIQANSGKFDINSFVIEPGDVVNFSPGRAARGRRLGG